jgi:hypothetical protein
VVRNNHIRRRVIPQCSTSAPRRASDCWLKPHATDWAQIDRFLASAEKKLASAHKILAFDEEASLQQAYEAMLKASIGFMFSHGFRPRSQLGHHIAIIEFVPSRLDKNTLAC